MVKRASRATITHDSDPAVTLARATMPLLEMFACVDDVFSEDDALSPDKRQMSLGRIYRTWKSVRTQLDPTYNRHKDHRVKKSNR